MIEDESDFKLRKRHAKSKRHHSCNKESAVIGGILEAPFFQRSYCTLISYKLVFMLFYDFNFIKSSSMRARSIVF